MIRILEGPVRGSVIDAPAAAVPLPGGREGTPTSRSIDVRAAGTGRRPFLRTPRGCPSSGRRRFVYDDPPGRQRPYDLGRCRR